MRPRGAVGVVRWVSLALVVGLLLGVPWVLGAGVASHFAGPMTTAPSVGPARPSPHAPSYSLSTVDYTSSVDGFSLSYNELLPAGYSSTQTYPMAVELHGISSSETTPMPGGYPTTTPTSTLDAASAAGFILVVPNTRTGVGFYADSPFTGPQEQDVLDAIASEQSRHSVGSVYVYGFSMGAMGAVAIALSHPAMFAGVGAIATFSDLYETTAYQFSHNQTSLPNLLLDVAGGFYPNGSAFSHQVFDNLSQLRFHPERTSGLKVYLASGGQDSSATNNAVFWPYQQGNDSVLETSCLVVSAYDEASNCTRPLAVLSAVAPANFTYRYLYEPNGPHDYNLLNPTDLYRYFLGLEPAGTYYGLWPVPTPIPPTVPLVTLATVPSNCGTLVLDGTPYPGGFTFPLARGNHTLDLSTCPGSALASVRTTGGVTYDGESGTLNVVTSGAIVATFSPPIFHVALSANVLCDAVSLNGTIVANGTVVDRLGGTYALAAVACPPLSFTSWNSTGGVRVGNLTAATTTLTIFGNGSVQAQYQLPTPPPQTGRVYAYVAPAICGPVEVDGTWLEDGTFADLTEAGHGAVAPSCALHDFAGWTLSGGVLLSSGSSLDRATVNFTVFGDGSLTAVYAPRTSDAYWVAVGVNPLVCGAAVLIDQVAYSNGTVALLAPGIHSLTAASCPSHDFHSWIVYGGVVTTTDSVTVSGNGSLTAAFVAQSPSGDGGGGNSSIAASPWSSSPVLWGVVGAAVGLSLGLGVAWRWRRPAQPPG